MISGLEVIGNVSKANNIKEAIQIIEKCHRVNFMILVKNGRLSKRWFKPAFPTKKLITNK